ncbi:MAG: gliding motility protein GldC [Ferruginibacter sp.]|nr:gliding motility protein GldC [Cytophagales bacterium]
MKKSEIRFTVELDAQSIPEKIFWEATDNPNEGIEETRAVAIALWDHHHRGTLSINLWAKDMEVGAIKQFYIEVMGGLAESLLKATGDQPMADGIENLCRHLTHQIEKELKKETKK